MVKYEDIKTEIENNWRSPGGLTTPIIYNKRIRYSTKYINRLFIKVATEAPIIIKSQSNDGGVTLQKNFFYVDGVYDTYDNAILSAADVKQTFTEKAGWYITGNATPMKTRRRYTYRLPCYAREIFQKGDFA